jgi:prepilin-type N-terminal cleavage/methylation domain-containing protein
MLAPKRNLKRGFTLVELLVTISIFVILTGVVLFNQQKFNSTILLTNLAYDTALTIRQAQTYGVNIKEFDSGSGSQFVPYGVYFDKAANKSFILFADIDYDFTNKTTDGIYDGKDNPEQNPNTCKNEAGCVNRYNITRGNVISEIEVTNGTVTIPMYKLNILFQRPNPDAKILAKTRTGNYGEYNAATITLMGVDGSIRKVRVQQNGLIEIINN